MPQDAIWNLLTLTTTSLTIIVSVLLWFIANFLNLLQQAEVEGKVREHKAFSTSTTVVVITVSIILILIVGSLSGVVAWDNIAILEIRPGSKEFYLLFFSILVPILVSLGAGLLMLENVGWRNITESFISFFSRLRAKPLDLSTVVKDIELKNKPSYKTFPHTDLVHQDWIRALEWAKMNERKLGLGKGFMKYQKNQIIFISIVDRAWGHLQAGESPSADEVPQIIGSELALALEKLKAYHATIKGRPFLIARAACALYAEKIQD